MNNKPYIEVEVTNAYGARMGTTKVYLGEQDILQRKVLYFSNGIRRYRKSVEHNGRFFQIEKNPVSDHVQSAILEAIDNGDDIVELTITLDALSWTVSELDSEGNVIHSDVIKFWKERGLNDEGYRFLDYIEKRLGLA